MKWKLLPGSDNRTEYLDFWHRGNRYQVFRTGTTAGDIYTACYYNRFECLASAPTLSGLFKDLGIASQPQLLFT